MWLTPLILAFGRLGRQIWVRAQPGLHSKHQDSQGYMVRPCLRDGEVVRMRICCSLVFIASSLSGENSSFTSVWRSNSRPCRCQPSTFIIELHAPDARVLFRILLLRGVCCMWTWNTQLPWDFILVFTQTGLTALTCLWSKWVCLLHNFPDRSL